MNTSTPGKETQKKSDTAKVQARAQHGTSCPFCGFVLALYPTLKGMTERDGETFRDHLKKSHGLKPEIEA
jgi:hypothetical protein